MAAERLRLAALAGAASLTLGLGGCGAARSRRPASTPADEGIPASLIAQARPIGRGPRFHPPAAGPVLGPCRSILGPRVGVHVELFAANRVVLVGAGIGARPPLTHDAGRISGARCFGALVTVDPTGTVLVRPGSRLTLADLFRSWGQPLSPTRLASFPGRVRIYIDGRRRPGNPGRVALTRHAEIVLEVGPYVPPHSAYRFPPGT